MSLNYNLQENELMKESYIHSETFYSGILYVGMLISLWLFLFPIFLFAGQPKEFLLERLKKSEQQSHKYVELRVEYVE
jgi:4-amino-4-deoxy-L-arabinose transferase-like glycosyltransferase